MKISNNYVKKYTHQIQAIIQPIIQREEIDIKDPEIVIYGHKINLDRSSKFMSHTHCPIHYGFYKAFNELGYKTAWIDKNTRIDGCNFDNTIFLTEGQVDESIPLIKTAKYILHNCNLTKYIEAGIPYENILIIQTITTDIFSRNIEKVSKGSYYQKDNRTLYLAWGTDLLPEEIIIPTSLSNKNRNITFIGSSSDNDLDVFIRAGLKDGIQSHIIDPWQNPISFEENKRIISESYLAPALQGRWQREKGYIPCRIFKNISYGSLGISNSQYVKDFFDTEIIFDNNCDQLYEKAKKEINNLQLLQQQMIEVKENHTYIHRIRDILKFLI